MEWMSRIFQKDFHCFPFSFHSFPKSFLSFPRIFVIFTYMAKFIIESSPYVEKEWKGVQDVSQMPDMYVERWEDGKCRRYRVGVDFLSGGVSSRVEFGDEAIDFVWDESVEERVFRTKDDIVR